jgi:hypothetical protein
MKSIYSAWHLNLAFSSIEDSEAGKLIDKCYWPLLDLLNEPEIKFGIELSGWTLNRINEIDSLWVHKAKELINSGKIEILGSGWAQIISPLVPSFITDQNLKFGNIAYSEILGIVPKVGFVNEQCWSTSLVQNYLDAGYNNIVMEWENPFSINPHWASDSEFRIQNTSFCGASIGVIWNSSTAFQKLQKLTHGDITPGEWKNWFSDKASGLSDQAFCIYGGDTETFGYRANRFEGEGSARPQEWDLVRDALNFATEAGSKFILPSEFVASSTLLERTNLVLNSVETPIPTKKQPKYNPLRWAVGGRDANMANTRCFNIAKKLAMTDSNPDDWRQLLCLWGSDFRTHTTETKWIKWQSDCTALEKKLSHVNSTLEPIESSYENEMSDLKISEVDHYLSVESSKISIILNKKRGLAVDSLIFKDLGEKPIVGTTRHGEVENIDWNADFYTGELVIELPGEPKITDLVEVNPKIIKTLRGCDITTEIASKLGSIQKKISISDGKSPVVEISYSLDWECLPASSLRFGDIVVLTEFFDPETLFLKTHNGGTNPEHFLLKGRRVEHGKHLSTLISSVNCFGVTEGYVEIGDSARSFYVHVDQSISYVPALLTYIETARKNLFRLQFSARELDDTSAKKVINTLNTPRQFSIRISKDKE